ncbi:outer membrane protein, protease secretion system [Nitrosospira multiformis ATCC 25196]|uniref:Outer membrane protein, protease secretion system n=1 Tax=Nitrosospira multiformis (strain ATCC 25196 / NCIMB 11849 / C 71) TaxID=323848 RepID=Q2Y9I6_NITMU|nr:TolC family outer membrane protein [Nitrosospira multiformis]ABB74585.1 Type I secretion outer membrane protein, TolC [Nitrosospira multiformis ATCC 25196]SEF95247.1 outer membrane protein, protease secretion system [Nitrosospira multiformis ATCC 25196]
MTPAARVLIAAAIGLGSMLHAGHASALGLMEAYEAAVANDPAYRAAIHENRAGQEFTAIGLSGLLPSLSANFSINQNQQDFTRQSITLHRSYESQTAAIQLRQPIINLAAFAGYKQGIAKTSQSNADFSGQMQELILRLVSAYVEAKYAEDGLALAVAQSTAYAEQRQANERMLEKGEGTKTEALETQASYDLAQAQVLEAEDNVAMKRDVLAAIVGEEISALDPLSDDFRVKPMQPGRFDDWKDLALENNPDIAGQRHAVDVAREEINKQRAGHFPRLDAVAAITRNKSDSPILVGIDALTQSIGVQVNLPLYAGGNVSAMTSQAASNYEKARADLDTTISETLVELRKQFNLALTSTSRIAAFAKSVDSANLLIEATTKSIRGGVRTNLDLLNAQQRLFEAKRDLAEARYGYLLAYLRLRRAAGIVGFEDLHDIAGYFIRVGNSPAPINTARAKKQESLQQLE